MTPAQQAKLLRRGLILEYLTLAWNVIGTIVTIAAAVSARSVALAGFGFDSAVEIGASLIVVWHLRGIHKGRERRALRLIAIAFCALAAYVGVQSTCALVVGTRPGTSPLGMAWLAVTCTVMLALAAAKHVTGARLGNQVLKTEAKVTLVDAWLAGSVLFGLALNASLGWWWADSAACLVIIAYGIFEGRHAWIEANASTRRA